MTTNPLQDHIYSHLPEGADITNIGLKRDGGFFGGRTVFTVDYDDSRGREQVLTIGLDEALLLMFCSLMSSTEDGKWRAAGPMRRTR